MKIQEISEAYEIPYEQIASLEKEGFFDHLPLVNGEREVSDQELSILCKLLKLRKFGMDKDAIQAYFKEEQCHSQEKKVRCKLLKKQRETLLDDIHMKQKDVDCLDYLLYELEQSL